MCLSPRRTISSPVRRPALAAGPSACTATIGGEYGSPAKKNTAGNQKKAETRVARGAPQTAGGAAVDGMVEKDPALLSGGRRSAQGGGRGRPLFPTPLHAPP